MSKYTCIVIDDDPLSCSLLEGLIATSEIVELIGKYTDAEIGALAIEKDKPDILFLDIEMPKIKGNDIIKNLVSEPEIIIITAAPEYALMAYDWNIVDFLVKPLTNLDRFLVSLEKAIKNLKLKQDSRVSNYFIKVDSAFVNISRDKIKYIQAYGDFVKVITTDKTYVIKSKLQDIEYKLTTDFIKIHRSYIVNVKHIKNITQNNLMVDSEIIPISNSYRKLLLEKINLL